MNQQQQQQKLQRKQGVVLRKTSAEIVNEAKNMLAGGVVRLISTKRPITPREPRRLYGKLAPSGQRPPSAFSLRYLQFESRALPSIEPLPTISNGRLPDRATLLRTQSSGSLNGREDDSNNNQNKLPALLLPPAKISASVDNLYEEMPPRNDCDKPATPTTNPSIEFEKKKKVQSIDASKSSKSNGTDDNIKKTRLLRTNDLLAQSSTETLLDMLKANAGIKECSDETVAHINGILTELYLRVKGARGEWRGAVLGSLYGLVECESPKILLSVARVVLVLCVTGSNLTGACKLVFKVARNATNDYLFFDCDIPELLIEGLGRASPIEDPEACIYGYGAVRFLASMSIKDSDDTNVSSSGKTRTKTVSQRLVRQGAMQLMILHLQILNEFGATTKLSHQLTHVLFQLSGAFRGLVLAKSSVESDKDYVVSSPFSATAKQFPQIQETREEETFRLHQAIPHLVRAAEISMGEMVVQTNLVRTLSIMSENDECCRVLSEYSSRLGILLGPIGKDFPEKSMGMLVRLGYVLGNVMAKYDSARCQFFNNDVAMDYLLSTLESCSNKNFLNQKQQGEVLDVTIKLVRVIANMSVNNEVGYGLGVRKSLGNILLKLLLAVNNCKLKSSAELEELLLATLGALHNLSFYQDLAEGDNRNPVSSMAAKLSELSTALCSTIVSGPIAAKAEAARVLGNMTRCSKVRNHFCDAGGLKVIVQQLRSDDLELVAASCGILVNLLGDWERRSLFRELNGPSLLVDALQHGAMQNWVLAGIICQAMWNYLIDSPNIVELLGENETEFIAGMLSEYLDEETLFNGERPDQIWEQFAIVATDLLERIQTAMPYMPYASSDDDDDGIQVGKTDDYWGGQFRTWLDNEQ